MSCGQLTPHLPGASGGPCRTDLRVPTWTGLCVFPVLAEGCPHLRPAPGGRAEPRVKTVGIVRAVTDPQYPLQLQTNGTCFLSVENKGAVS